jgi:predicted kinase
VGVLPPDARVSACADARTRGHRPTLFLLVGLPGAGKTTRARELEREHGALRLSPDEWMLPLFGESEAGGARDVLEGRFVWVARRVLGAGTDVVLDFGLWGRDERSALRALAAAAGAQCSIVWLPIDEATQRERVLTRFDRTPGETFAMTDADLAEQWRIFQPPTEDEFGAVVDPPPAGYDGWPQWIAERWPSAGAD